MYSDKLKYLMNKIKREKEQPKKTKSKYTVDDLMNMWGINKNKNNQG